MENSLRAVCANIRVGKMLITAPTPETRAMAYAKLPRDIGPRHVMVLEPVINTGRGVITAVEALLANEVGCSEDRIIVLAVIASAEAARDVCTRFPKARVVVSAVDPAVDENGAVVPGAGDFSTRYFGTD
jgi:uracil phosphoribosyltransferase